jgi:hypothetical protein
LSRWQHWLADGTVREITTLTASLYYYPLVRSGLFIEGGIGLSDCRVRKGVNLAFTNPNADTIHVSGTGWGATVGLGYEVPVGRWLSIGPRVAAALGGVGTLPYPGGGTAAMGWKQNVLAVGIGLSFGL